MSTVITGVGLVTALGRTADQTWQSLLGGQFISTHARLEPTLERPISRVASFALEAVEPALSQANWTKNYNDVAVIACTSKGSVESWIDSTSAIANGFGLADLSSLIARHIGSTIGARLTLSAACAGGLHGLIRGAMMIQSGEASRVLVVAAEASVHPLFLSSFQRLGVLPSPGELCRPFDQHRTGFLMSDAAAAICLESGPNDRTFATIERFAMGGDATHLTGSDPQAKVLRRLLGEVMRDNAIDLFHAHGTGTMTNDAAEVAAMNSVLTSDSAPNLFSHKAALGHSLGASGLLSVVINCLCHKHNIIPPNINTTNPIQTEKIRLRRGSVYRNIRRSVVHAAGFGGPTAVVALAG